MGNMSEELQTRADCSGNLLAEDGIAKARIPRDVDPAQPLVFAAALVERVEHDDALHDGVGPHLTRFPRRASGPCGRHGV